jgi:hypothetical protein
MRSQGGSLRPFVNLYIQWPFDDDEAWSQLIAAVARTSYQHSLLGFGVYYAGWTCTICHVADHPSGLCPFPLILGWIKAAPIPPVVEHHIQFSHASSQNTGQPMRGQGGGRGSNHGGNGRNNNNTPGRQRGLAHSCGVFNLL